MAQSIMNTLYIAIQPSNTAAHSKMDFKAFISTIKVWGKHMSTYLCGLHLHDFLPKLEAVILTATVNWTHMIDFDFSAVVHPICGQTSAEVKSCSTQNCCRGHSD